MTWLTLGDLRFEVRRSERRRTLGITVERDGSLVLSAPPDVPAVQLERFVKEKRFWVYEKLATKEALHASRPARQYVTGEGVPYLGRSYRLLLVDKQEVPLKLEAGWFKMLRPEATRGRPVMIRWYMEHALPWLRDRAAGHAGRVPVRPSAITVRDLGYRWGSCGKERRLYFHWQVILLPPRIIDYVVIHELVHLNWPHHTPEFWRAVERALPDWEARRRWLTEHGEESIL